MTKPSDADAEPGAIEGFRTDAASRKALAWLIVAAAVLFLPSLGVRDFWYPDEPDVAEVCKAMYESGDWIAPRRMGVIWVDYPPMMYWTGTAASHLLGGVSEFALRLPNALASIATLWLIFVTARRWYGLRAGAWAGLVLLTLVEFARQGVSYRPDVLFSLWIAAGLIVYARGAPAEGARWGPRVAGFFMLGLAMLAKGPLGLLLPGLALTLWHGSRREWRRLIEMAPLSLVALAVYMPWFVACARAMGAESILGELYAQNFGRFVSGSRGHDKPIYYYFVFFWNLFWPWSILFPFAATWLVRAKQWRDRNTQLALWWFGAFFVFLTLASTKRGVYLLPIYPALALLVAPWLAAIGQKTRAASRWAGGIAWLYGAMAIVLLLVAVFTERIGRALDLDKLEWVVASAVPIPLAVTAVVVLGAAIWIGAAWRRGDVPCAVWRVGVAHLPIYFVLLVVVFPTFNPIKSYRAQSQWIRGQIGTEDQFGLANPTRSMAFRKMGMFGYYSGAHAEVLRTGDAVEGFLRDHPESLVLVEEQFASRALPGSDPAWLERVQGRLQTGRYRYYILRSAPTTAPLEDRAWLSAVE